MSTTISSPENASAPTRPATRPSPTRRSRWPVGVIIIGLVLIAGAVYGVPRIIGGFASETTKTLLTHEAKRGELLVTVTEEGNVESASNIEVKCQVAGGSSILWIVEDGTQVEEGEKIVELDASALEEQINTQQIAFEKARSTKIQSEKTFSVAKISVTEYLEGTYKQALQDAQALITIAEENLRSSQNALEHSEKMFRKGYVSSLELEGQKFSVERAKLELDSAKTAKDVLEKFTKEKTVEDLVSQRDNAEAQMKSDAAAFDLEKVRLERLEAQLANCTLYAPQSGMVVYANERGGRFGQSEATVEEGASVRERQTILRLPDLSQMQVRVNVHESKVDQIQPGMRARIRILDNEFTGSVTSVANQPEPSSFFSGNVKEYATLVRVSGEKSETLRPGMTAEVEILVAHLKNALTLPVAAVVEQRGKFFCWVDLPAGPEKRPLILGASNDEFVEVKDGVAEGESVLLNPRAVVKEAREIVDAEEAMDVSQKFGDAPTELGPGPGGPGPGGPGMRGNREGRGGGPGGGPGMRQGPGMGGPGGADRNGGEGPGGNRQGPGGGGRGGGRPDLSQLDKDGDGKISKEEAPAQMQNFFDNIDSNGDGFIDNAEMTEMRNRFQQRAGGGGGPGGGGPGGGPGRGGPPQD